TARSSCCCARRPASTSRSSGWSRGGGVSGKAPPGRERAGGRARNWGGGGGTGAPAGGNGPPPRVANRRPPAPADPTPHAADTALVNFKVRILDETKGTEAITRVLLDASDGHHLWGSIGVSENVIAASWYALVDSLEYATQPGREIGGGGASDAAGSGAAGSG